MSCILRRGEAKMGGHLCGTMTAGEELEPCAHGREEQAAPGTVS